MAKAICLQMYPYMIQKQQQCLKVKETSLVMTQCPRNICPQQYHNGLARLHCAYVCHGLVLAPGLLPPLHPSPKRSQQLLPSAVTDADAKSWSCQGYTSGLEWESLTSSSARDGRTAD